MPRGRSRHTSAIVVDRTKLGESDLILTLLEHDGSQGRAVQFLAKGILRLVEARGIHYHDLAIRRVDNSAKTLARGLRDGAGDGEPLAHAGIEQRGLASVGATDEGDKATTEWFVLRHGNHSLEELLDCGGPKNDKPRNTDKQA